MPAYATPAQVADYLGIPILQLPPNINGLLEVASELIDYATLNRINLDPTDDNLEAAKKATIYQYEFWSVTGDQSDVVGQSIESFSLGSLSVNFNTSSGGPTPNVVAPRAKRVLVTAGLYYRGVRNV